MDWFTKKNRTEAGRNVEIQSTEGRTFRGQSSQLNIELIIIRGHRTVETSVVDTPRHFGVDPDPDRSIRTTDLRSRILHFSPKAQRTDWRFLEDNGKRGRSNQSKSTEDSQPSD